MIRDTQQLVQSLRASGYNIVVRHGATFANQADTDPFNFDDVAKQRKSTTKARSWQGIWRCNPPVGLPVGEVYTSKFNRAYETAIRAGFRTSRKQST